MQQTPGSNPRLRAVPLGGDPIKLISFAQSLVEGKIRITSDAHNNQQEVVFTFSDYRDPAITYHASRAQVWDCTRYIAATIIHKMMQQQDLIDRSHPANLSSEEKERIERFAKERRAARNTQLAPLNVSRSLIAKNHPSHDFEKTMADTTICDTDTPQVIHEKTNRMINALEHLKNEPSFMQAIAFTRFYRFWSGEDLTAQTKNDRTRNLHAILETRRLFFSALEKNDTAILSSFGDQFKILLKKQPRSLAQTIEKMIENLKKYKHVDPSSPQNSDEEIL